MPLKMTKQLVGKTVKEYEVYIHAVSIRRQTGFQDKV